MNIVERPSRAGGGRLAATGDLGDNPTVRAISGTGTASVRVGTN
ncbi:hypothetical protein [Micromonospora vulcania]|uniref:Uncharacterized protein n=1 Tax=Micromonospora vulcania TaxID=1441873 RepID=A0ABW1H0I2_9ACTN